MTIARFSAAGALVLAALAASAAAQDSVSLASKSVPRVYAVQNRVFALAEGGTSFSWLNLFTDPPQVKTPSHAWPWDGGAEGGAPWSQASPLRQSLLLRSDYAISDSQRVARAASVFYNAAPDPAKSDSLILRDPPGGNVGLAAGAALTSMAVWRDTAILGFGKLGFAYAPLAAEIGPVLFAGDTLAFRALPSGVDTLWSPPRCVWNTLCRVDTAAVPAGGLDSILAVAVDSTSPDSAWLLLATQSGLRRGLWGSNAFPRVNLPGAAGATVVSVFASPSRSLLWAFTASRFFYSDDHGATFRTVPDTLSGVSLHPDADLRNYAGAPQAAFSGDTTFVSFNLDQPGLVLFRRDTVLAHGGTGLQEVLVDTGEGLDIVREEGSLTGLAVARGGATSVLAAGSTLKGIFYRRLDLPATDFSNLNRLRSVKNGLAEVITYPTLFSGFTASGAPQYVGIGYRLKKSGKVTITVYDYAMEKVRTIVKNAPRNGGIARSENVAEDRWDGRDSGGRLVSVGTYYILVESDGGEKAFGKAICVRGRK